MNKTPQELYDQAKQQTNIAVELTRTGNLNELGPALSRLETTFQELKRVDPDLDVVQTASREFGPEGPIAVRVLAYANDTAVLESHAHLVAAEKAVAAGDIEQAREIYKMIQPGTEFRRYLDAQRLALNDLNKRASELDKKLEE